MSHSSKDNVSMGRQGQVDSILWNERAASKSGPFPRTLNLGITFDLDPWYRNA
jgi:hypothetical protein